MSLKEIYEKYITLTDKGSTHSYLETYEELLSPFVGKNAVLLELGVHLGGSLLLWNDYLVNAAIHGVDIIEKPARICEIPNIKYYRLNCSDHKVLDGEFRGTEFDIIIDDASHVLRQQIASFNILYPRLKKGGVYVIEDILDGNFGPLRALDKSAKVIDMRSLREKRDNVLVVYRK